MRRWLTAAATFAIGLGGSFAAVSVSQSPVGLASGELLGEPDFKVYCTAAHGDRSVPLLRSPNAGGWHCGAEANRLFVTYPIDVEAACSQQFGEPSYASSYDPTWPNSWECFAGEPG